MKVGFVRLGNYYARNIEVPNAAQPALCLPAHLPPGPAGRMLVIGPGIASAAMARAVADNVDGPLERLVVTRYGHAVPCECIE